MLVVFLLMRFYFFSNKKGENQVSYALIYILISLVFFIGILFYLNFSSSGSIVYEQFYAKKISLLIDNSLAPSRIIIDFKKGLEIAEENKISKQEIIDIKDNKVIVSLSKNKGYLFNHFSDFDIDFYFQEENLVLNLNEKIK